MSAPPAPAHRGELTEVRPGLWREDFPGGTSLHGAPFVLSRVCSALGFENKCAGGRVSLSRRNAARLGAVLDRVLPR